VAAGTHLDSWDVIGPYDNHLVEVENHFDIPIKGKKKGAGVRVRSGLWLTHV
jgi:hypothetical protein